MIYYLIFVCLSLLSLWLAWKISVTDFKRRIIPDVYLFPLMLIGLIFVVFFPWICSVQESVLGAFFGYGLAMITGILFSKIRPDLDSPIGMGDIKMLSAGGLWLGVTGLSIALILSCIFGSAWGVYKKQKYIPFGPFFIASSFLTLIILRFLL